VRTCYASFGQKPLSLKRYADTHNRDTGGRSLPMKAISVGAWILVFGWLSLSCSEKQEIPERRSLPTTKVENSCDFTPFKPLKGSFDSHPNPNDVIATPIYPDDVRSAGIEGVVALKLLVNGSGNVEQVCVQSGDPKLIKTSEEAARKSTFAPILINGKAVPYFERTLRFNYVLSAERAVTVR